MAPPYFTDFAAAYVRGRCLAGEGVDLPEALARAPLEALSAADREAVVARGLAAGLRLHRFKRTMGLRRVERVLGVLRSLGPASVLDVGSGRGAFLWPLMDALPWLPVTATDVLAHRARDLQAVRAGGVGRLTVLRMDAAAMPLSEGAFDVVTFLEVLEHLSDPPAALGHAVRVARRSVVLSVPSKPDDNPEHVHLFSEASLRRLLAEAGAARVNVCYVLNHMIAVASR